MKLVMLLLLLLPSIVNAEIIYGIDKDFAPYEWVDNKGQPRGFNVELMQEVASIHGVKLTIVSSDWESIVHAFNAGEIDVITIGIASDGSKNSIVTKAIKAEPFSLAYSHIYTRLSSADIYDLNDLHGLTVAINQWSYTELALITADLNIELIYASSEKQALNLVSEGKADAAIINAKVGHDTLGSNRITNLKVSGLPLFPRTYAFASRNDAVEIQKQIHDSLIHLSNNGQLFKLRESWFGTTDKIRNYATMKTWFINITTFGILIFIAAMVWVVSLRHVVNCRTRELKIQSAIAQEKAKLATLGTLSAGIAHEINNPNGIIIRSGEELGKNAQRLLNFTVQTPGLEMDLLLHNIDLNKISIEMTQQQCQITQSSKKISNIVKELKDYARPTPATEFHDMSAGELCQATLLLCSPLSKNYNVELYDNSLKRAINIYGNKARLEQVLVNIIENAIHACPTSGGVIYLAVTQSSTHNVISVRDNGHGMSEHTLSQADEGFFTTRRTEGGMGLGLAICKRIIIEHQGYMEIESQLNIGTTVSIFIPKR
ncbi:transporter substrate-binding domain-containing protein [Shewanella sp. 3_MG-2023]|uniref:ATP-binding protein n=1 Tax=Shewanella sp. 3_MG-2023 TaxID=3062635 RepID=UPI0026E16DD6|nr:transporter substrate-binding domain-containing protein [Shewanella sp. 3_MG-2023]MDO6775133.1 transporter substrate-binding domain-containing protein [Shewanella sp. 3_MG-2023]